MKRLFSFCLLILSFGIKAHAQHPKELAPGYYVVVAAFSPPNEQLAINFKNGLNKKGLKAGYGYNSERNYFYVFLNHHPVRKPSIEEMVETRRQEQFSRAWVRKVSPYNSNSSNRDNATSVSATPPELPIERKATVQPASPLKDTTAVVVEDTVSEEFLKPETFDAPPVDETATEIFVNLFNATNNKTIEGTVKVVDPEKAKLIKEIKGNDFLDIPNPKTKSGTVLLICEAFGYRKLQQEITYPMTLADTVKEFVDMMGPTFIINFNLVRYNKGDIATLYEVFFFNDAAIMLPESRYELTSLLEMMKENPDYRIRLHGHTNGNYRGQIMLMGESRNFFALAGAKRTSGSAKDLSRERAELIRQYLIDQGIDGTRVEVKAWGGKRPIYDKHSNSARKNVRVEVEILEE